MIKAGYVEQNRGFGIYPSFSSSRWGTTFTERPFEASDMPSSVVGMQPSSYQPTIKVAPGSVSKPFQNDFTPKLYNPPTFGQTTYNDLFGRRANEVVDYVAERIKGGQYIKPIGPTPMETTHSMKPTFYHNVSETLQNYLKSLNLPPSAAAEITAMLPKMVGDLEMGKLSDSDFKTMLDESVSTAKSSYKSVLAEIDSDPITVFQPTETGAATFDAPQRFFEKATRS